MAKYGMSMCTLGHAGEFRKYGIAVNSLGPRTAIATAALPSVRGDLLGKLGRHAEARAEFLRAAGLAGNVRERELLLARAAGLPATPA